MVKDHLARELVHSTFVISLLVTDQIEKGRLTVEHYPTGDMIADFMTKPLQGKPFEKFRSLIMGHECLMFWYSEGSETNRSVLENIMIFTSK